MSPILNGLGGISVRGFGHFVNLYTSSFDSIATTTVGAGGASTITFSSIPQTYTHLQLRWSVRNSTNSQNNMGMYVRFNGATSNYWFNGGNALYGNGTTASSANSWNGGSTTGIALGQIPANNTNSSILDAGIADIFDYTNTNKFKTVRSLQGYDTNNTATGQIFIFSGAWGSSAAIASLTVVPDAALAQNSIVALYGIKVA
jgi:hypothetical protein